MKNLQILIINAKFVRISSENKSSFDQITYDRDDSGNSFDPSRTVVRKFHLARWTDSKVDRMKWVFLVPRYRRFPIRDLIRTYVRLCYFRTEEGKLYYRHSLSELNLFSGRNNHKFQCFRVSKVSLLQKCEFHLLQCFIIKILTSNMHCQSVYFEIIEILFLLLTL